MCFFLTTELHTFSTGQCTTYKAGNLMQVLEAVSHEHTINGRLQISSSPDMRKLAGIIHALWRQYRSKYSMLF
jgi:hypothetical protein